MSGLASMFNPKATAVVGASKTPGKIGHTVLTNIINSGYKGKIYPINPKETVIEGYTCYKSLVDVPETVDLALITVPAKAVLSVATDCAQAKVKNIVVITAGFKEVGKEGMEMEKKLVALCKENGINMVGPNCLGIMDTHTPINATFAKDFALKGQVAFVSQSGALCLAILDWSLKRGLGFSQFISIGNKAHLNEADFIEAAANDPNTKVILAYLEDVVDGPRFLKVCGEVTKSKPIIIYKAGASQAGARAASSHTGALAGSDLAYDLAFRKAGIIRARSMTEIFDLATAFITQPLPKGRKVALVTNSGGPGIIATDNVENSGLEMARFEKTTIDDLRANLPPESNVYNPIDVLGDADYRRYEFALNKALDDPNVDAAVVLLSPTGPIDPLETARVILRARETHPDKPVTVSFTGGFKVEEGTEHLLKNGVPCFPFPEPAIGSVVGLYKYSEAKAKRDADGLEFKGVDKAAVKKVFDTVKKDNRVVLLAPEAVRVADLYGIPAAPSLLATKPEEAVAFANKMEYPVVLKVSSPEILHKSDIGGVKVGLATAKDVHAGFVDIIESVNRHMPNAKVYGIEVAKMMPKGTELIIGMTKDVQFGPMVAFGLGGIWVNLIKDVSFRLAAGLSKKEIENMITETKAYTILRGFRGSKPLDIPALVDAIARVAKLVTDFPEITELDINPVVAYEKGVSALDIKITIS